MDRFDIMIIGGGPAGYNAAERAAAAGMNTLLFEQRALGGVCLNEGCVPSKTFLHSAKVLDHAKNGAAYGVTAENVSLDQAQVLTRKDKIVRSLTAGIAAKLRKAGVTVVSERAQILGKDERGFSVRAGETEYLARFLLLATGSSSFAPPIPGLSEGLASGFVLTNKEILELREIPAELVVIGGGTIGLEMANYFHCAGSHVTIIEQLGQIGGSMDGELAEILQKNFTKRGIEIRLLSTVTEIEQGAVLYRTQSGTVNRAPATKILLAAGRKPNLTGFGLENLHVYTQKGAVVTDAQMRTNVPDLFAAGDVNGKYMLAHVAYREGEVAVNTMLGKQDTMRYSAVPQITYTNPELASVGESEESAKKKGIPFTVRKLSMRYSGRYLAENEGGDGIMKLLLDPRYDRVIGVHMLANSASESIYGAGLMIETELSVKALQELIFPHPTVCEVIREALFEE